MCDLKLGRLEIEILAAVRAQVGLQAMTAWEQLREKGACLVHFSVAVQTLAATGQIRSGDPSTPIVPSLAPAKLLELGLESPRGGEEPVRSSKDPVRVLEEGFKVFLDQPLGKGSFGAVYRGEQVRLNRPVAIKILRLDKLPKGPLKEQLIQRFRREPRIIARLNHPHIVQVIDCGEERDEMWYAMELLEGGTMLDRIRGQGRLSPREVRACFLAMADALREAAEAGILHRDVKPGNIFNAGMKLADFGLAKMPPSPTEGGGAQPITRTAALMGTLAYIAPERAHFQGGDFRSDIYSLGATMYHAASGRTLFDLAADDRQGWCHNHVHTEPTPLRMWSPDFPRDVATVIHRCLAKDPGDRYKTFEDLQEALEKTR